MKSIDMKRMLLLPGLLLLGLFLNCLKGTNGKSLHDCHLRFEFRDSIKANRPVLNNCTEVLEMYPLCRQKVRIKYAVQPPYVAHEKDNGKPIGIIPDLLNLILDMCCFGCIDVAYEGPVPFIELLKEQENEDNATIFMPIAASYEADRILDRDYVPMVKTDTVSVMALELDDTNKTQVGPGLQNRFPC